METIRRRPTYNIAHDGFILPVGFPLESYYSCLQYKPEEDDIFIATYPKCGTTWCQYIIYLLFHDGTSIDKDKNINDFAPHLEEKGLNWILQMPRPRIIKTHLPFNLVPYNSKTKYIYVARNPKDCCVSFYHHTRGFSKYYNFEDGSFDDYFELFIRGEVDFGNYFDNLHGWYEHRNDSNVLFLLYEDMKMDPKYNIRKIGRFLGGRFSNAVDRDDILEKVVERSDINSMKNMPKSTWSSERPKDMPAFVRKGIVGDWKNYFSEDQVRRLDEEFNKKLGETEAFNLWKN